MQILTNEGRIFQGLLKSFDQRTNVVLADCQENIFKSDQEPMEVVEIGAYFLRGDNVAIIAKVERNVTNGEIYGDPLPPMQL